MDASHVIVEIEQVQQLRRIELFLLELFHVEFHVGVGDSTLHFVVQAQTVSNAFVELLLRLVSDVNILVAFDAQYLRLVIDLSLHDTVSESLGNHEFHVLPRDVQLGSDVCQ